MCNFGHSQLLRDLDFHIDEISTSDAMQLSNSVKSRELLMHEKGLSQRQGCSLVMLLLTGHVVAHWSCCCLLDMSLLTGHVVDRQQK